MFYIFQYTSIIVVCQFWIIYKYETYVLLQHNQCVTRKPQYPGLHSMFLDRNVRGRKFQSSTLSGWLTTLLQLLKIKHENVPHLQPRSQASSIFCSSVCVQYNTRKQKSGETKKAWDTYHVNDVRWTRGTCRCRRGEGSAFKYMKQRTRLHHQVLCHQARPQLFTRSQVHVLCLTSMQLALRFIVHILVVRHHHSYTFTHHLCDKCSQAILTFQNSSISTQSLNLGNMAHILVKST